MTWTSWTPAAPPKAIGLSTAPITIADIPAPNQPDTVTPAHAETVTPLGTHIVVEKIKVSPNATGIKTWVVFRVVPPPDAADLQFQCSSGGHLVDNTGADVNPSGGGGSIGGGDQLSDPPAGNSRGDWTVGFFNAPAPGAKTLRLTLTATESSQTLKQDSWYRHFHLHVPLGTLWAGDRSAHTALATVQGSRVAASFESVGPAWGHYRVHLTLRDRADPTVLWRVHAIRAKDDTGNVLTGQPSPDDAFFWHVDGEPLGPEDTACETYLGLPGSPYDEYGTKPAPPAKTLALEADVEAVRYRPHVLDFPRVPVPAPGQTLTLNRRVTDAFGSRLVLRKVFAYSPAHPLPAGLPSPYSGVIAPAGLAVVMAEPPDPHGATSFDDRLLAANDATGSHLISSSGLASTEGDRLLVGPPPPGGERARVITYLLRAPRPGATTFNLRLGRDEIIPLGRTETVAFPPVTAPVLPDRPR